MRNLWSRRNVRGKFRGSARGILILGAVAMSLLRPSLAAAVDEEEEETSTGSVAASVPDLLAGEKQAWAMSHGFSLLAGLSAFVGSDDNVYRGPVGIRKRSSAWGNSTFVRADKRWNRGDKLIGTATWDHTRRPRHPNANSAYGNLSALYVRPLGEGLRIALGSEVSRKGDDATTIAGVDYARDYSYWRSAFDGSIIWRLSEHHTFTLGGKRILKDYGESRDLTSIDWTGWSATAEYRLRLAPFHYVEVLYSAARREYREELAANAEGTELAGNPPERHRYESVETSYTLPIGGRARLEAAYSTERKTDLFAGYENHRTNRAGLQAAVSFGTRFEARLGMSEDWRDYAKIRGDSGSRLSYTLRQAEIGSRVRVLDSIWIFASVTRYARDTNKSTGSSYRDYLGTLTSAGTSLYF